MKKLQSLKDKVANLGWFKAKACQKDTSRNTDPNAIAALAAGSSASTGTGSDVSSSLSSSGSDPKLSRIIQQLATLKTSMGDGRSGESSTPVPAKPDVGLVKPDECQGPPLGQPTRVELVTAMLKGMQPPRATQASVGAEPQKPQQSEANSKYVLPGYVLESLQKQLAKPVDPFPQHSQYIKEMEKNSAEGAAPNAEPQPLGGGAAKGQPGKSSVTPQPAETTPARAKAKTNLPKRKDSSWEYGSIRAKFLGERKAEGKTFQEAKALWDASEAKASYLGQVSVVELKKRRFLPKGSLSNPWAPTAEQS